MILELYPIFDPLTSFARDEAILHVYHRHKAFRVLAATSTRLRTIFLERSWKTRVLAETEIPTLAKFLGQPETLRALALHIGCVLSFTCALELCPPLVIWKSNPDLASHPSQETNRGIPE